MSNVNASRDAGSRSLIRRRFAEREIVGALVAMPAPPAVLPDEPALAAIFVLTMTSIESGYV